MLAVALAEYLDGPHGPFDWASSHCGHFVAGWIKAATGRDVLSGLLPAETAAGWVRVVVGAGGWRALVTSCLRCDPVPPAFAQIGDVVLLPGPMTGGTLGICAGRTVVLVSDDGASIHLPMSTAVAAWRLRDVSGAPG